MYMHNDHTHSQLLENTKISCHLLINFILLYFSFTDLLKKKSSDQNVYIPVVPYDKVHECAF